MLTKPSNTKIIISITVALLVFSLIGTAYSAPNNSMAVGADIYWGTTRSQWNSYSDLYTDCGLTYVRILISPSFMSNYRTLIPAIKASGVNIIGLFWNSRWMSYSQSNQAEYGAFVTDAVSEFKEYIHVWEYWNEPNLSQFWSNKNPADATKYLKECYIRAKAVDPDCIVLGGSVAWTHSTARNFIQGMYDAGARDYMDGFAHHPYCYPYAPDAHPSNPYTDLPKIKSLMEQNGDYNNIWVTELGWEIGGVTQQQQADYLVECLELARDWGWVDCFIIYQWKDGAKDMGITTSSVQPKTSYYAVQTFIETLDDPVDTYSLTIQRSDGGSTVPSRGTYNYEIGEMATVRATAYQDFNFDGWVLESNGNTWVYSDNPLSVVIDRDFILTAVFLHDPEPGYGTVQFDATLDGELLEGAELTITWSDGSTQTRTTPYSRSNILPGDIVVSCSYNGEEADNSPYSFTIAAGETEAYIFAFESSTPPQLDPTMMFMVGTVAIGGFLYYRDRQKKKK